MKRTNISNILILIFLSFFISIGMIYFQSKDVIAEKIILSDEQQNAERIKAAGLYVNGELFAVLPTAGDVQQVLDRYKEQMSKPSPNKIISSLEFVEKVEIRHLDAAPMEIKTVNEALNHLQEGKSSSIEYVVEKDDSVWLIAEKNKIAARDVLDSNPGLSEDSFLPAGQVIKLVKKEPCLNVRSQGTVVVQEVIPFEVETAYDPKLRSGSSIIKDIGKDGEAEVSYSYIEQNGKLISKEPMNKQILIQPVKQIIYLGPEQSLETEQLSAVHGSGKVSGMIWPLDGALTSYYGNRQGEFHTGLDIAGGLGQPYVAAASGTVLQTSQQGNYGNMILLDHGDGVVTRYAHSLKLLVTPGQKVSKGQVIGYVGSTGRSTGPHVHFEVIVNGKNKNPLDYL